tara:strand:+ start:305 stop:484 length:180 start_codon:yes stop_codon:yes gene_type:complete
LLRRKNTGIKNHLMVYSRMLKTNLALLLGRLAQHILDIIILGEPNRSVRSPAGASTKVI